MTDEQTYIKSLEAQTELLGARIAELEAALMLFVRDSGEDYLPSSTVLNAAKVLSKGMPYGYLTNKIYDQLINERKKV